MATAPIIIEDVPIDDDCIGELWTAADIDQLARLVALVAMGQAAYAAAIVSGLAPEHPVFTNEELRAEAKIRLTVQEAKQTPRIGYPRWQRDGFIFEAISWIAALQKHADALLKDPHVSSTTQGLDGLMLELDAGKTKVERTTVFEDKCTDDPKGTFANKVMPAFQARHKNLRSAEIVATASVLLRMAGLDAAKASAMAAAVTDSKSRHYRAALAVTDGTLPARKDLFAGYGDLKDIQQQQRVGASFVVSPKMRDRFDDLADLAIKYLEELAA